MKAIRNSTDGLQRAADLAVCITNPHVLAQPEHIYEHRSINVISQSQKLIDLRIIREIKEVAIKHDNVWLYSCQTICGGAYRDIHYVLPRICGGSGLSWEQARTRAIGEAAERYCAAVYDEHTLLLDCFDNLKSFAINPTEFALFSDKQYQEKDFPFCPFTGQTRINWTWGYSVVRRAPVLVPAAFVFRPYWPVGGETPIGLPPSTGLACGDSFGAAALSGLYEVVERDAIMIMWMNRLPAPRLPLSLYSASLPADWLQNSDFHLSVHDITTDIGIPTRFCLAIDKRQERPFVSCGASTRFRSEAALEKAIVEALHVNEAVRLAVDTQPPFDHEPDYRDVKVLEDHLLLFSHPQMLPALDFLLNAGKRDGATNSLPSLAGLSQGWAALQNLGLDLILVDLTLPELAKAGFFVVRALIPGLIPLTFGQQFVCKGGERLYRVPVALGYTNGPTREEALNPLPHPFA